MYELDVGVKDTMSSADQRDKETLITQDVRPEIMRNVKCKRKKLITFFSHLAFLRTNCLIFKWGKSFRRNLPRKIKHWQKFAATSLDASNEIQKQCVFLKLKASLVLMKLMILMTLRHNIPFPLSGYVVDHLCNLVISESNNAMCQYPLP